MASGYRHAPNISQRLRVSKKTPDQGVRAKVDAEFTSTREQLQKRAKSILVAIRAAHTKCF